MTYHPGFEYPWHHTASLDVVVVLAGHLELGLETGPVALAPGDCVIQRGTNHRWRVLGDAPATFVAVLIGAAPPA